MEHVSYVFWNRLHFKGSFPLFSLVDSFLLDPEFKRASQFTFKIIADQSFYDSIREQNIKHLGRRK